MHRATALLLWTACAPANVTGPAVEEDPAVGDGADGGDGASDGDGGDGEPPAPAACSTTSAIPTAARATASRSTCGAPAAMPKAPS